VAIGNNNMTAKFIVTGHSF